MDNWTENVLPPDDAAELKKIRKNLRNRNWKTVVTSLLLAAVILLVSVYGIVPAVESLYWEPYDSEYNTGSDLHMALKAYTELFHPGYTVHMVAGKTGFASYELQITQIDEATGEKDYIEGTLERGTLSLDYAYFDRSQAVHHLYADYSQDYPENTEPFDIRDMWTEEAVEIISQLPEYIQLKAVVFFPEDLTMEQFQQLLFKYNYDGKDGVSVLWTAVRVEGEDMALPPIGFSMHSYNGYELNETYPEFFIESFQEDGSHMAQHFKSLLKFSADQAEKGRGLDLRTSYSRYVLDYVEENGVNTYACLVSATPQGLQALLDSGTASHISLLDGWIDVG